MKKENAQVEFELQGIKAEQFAIFEKNYDPKKEVTLGTELQFKLDGDNKQIAVFLGFEFMQGKKIFLKIQVSCHFIIGEPSWNNFIQKSLSKRVVPRGFLAHLAMLTIGTTRGVLYSKTESTPFSKFIIPIVNVEEMIKEDISFEIDME